MDIAALAAELTAGHPDTGAYNADALTAANEINAVNRTTDKSSMTGDEIFAATDATQFGGLTADNKQLWMAFCGRSTVDPFGTANVALVTEIFGGGSATLTNLSAARKNNVSRANELGLGLVKPGHVLDARGQQ